MTWRRAAFVLALATVFGFSVFFVLAWNATTIERLTPEDAARRFDEARRPLGAAPSLLVRSPDGNLVRRMPAPAARPAALEALHVLAYHVAEARLIEVDVPFWFFRLKAPAARFMLRGTGVDLGELGLTADELEHQGPAVVLDEGDERGDRLLIWTSPSSR